MMICLLVDTSHINALLALYRITKENKKISCLAKLEWSADFVSHSSYIVLAFDKLLKKANILPSQIQSLFLGQGPGRFTGLRVAFSFMKSLSYVLKLPVHTCSSLRIWAEPALHHGGPPVLVLINAFKNSVFMACFKKTKSKGVKELISPCLCSPRQLGEMLKGQKNIICIGDAFFIYKEQIPLGVRNQCIVKENIVPRAQSFAQIVAKSPIDSFSKKNWDTLHPLYLKEGSFKKFS